MQNIMYCTIFLKSSYLKLLENAMCMRMSAKATQRHLVDTHPSTSTRVAKHVKKKKDVRTEKRDLRNLLHIQFHSAALPRPFCPILKKII